MPRSVPSRVRDTTVHTGTGVTITLENSPPIAHRAFSAVALNQEVPVVMAHRTLNEWQEGYGKRTGATSFEFTTVTDNHLGTTARVNFTAGVKDIFVDNHGSYLATLAAADAATLATLGADLAAVGHLIVTSSGIRSMPISTYLEQVGTDILSLTAAGAAAAGDYVIVTRADGSGSYRVPASVFSGGGSGDAAAPVLSGQLNSSAITAGGFTLTWPTATDNIGVAGYEYSVDGGVTYINAGNVNSKAITGLQPATTYPCRVRAYDAVGLRSTPISASVSTSASADSTLPTMNGTLTTTSITPTGFTMQWPAASDNVAIGGYDTSTDGGASWVDVGNVLARTVSGVASSTLFNLRVRAYDTSGNRAATPLSATVTTSAPTGDTTLPTMNGSITTSSVTSSGYVMSWPAASDNVAVTGYETSTDGGATWLDAGNVLTRTVSGVAASTAFNLRVRAYDAAGNRAATPLSATVTTSAVAPASPTLTKAGAVRVTAAATGVANVTTDVPNGTLYRYISANATETDATVKAANLTQPVTVAGNQPISLSGITGTTLYMHVLHRSAAGIDSAVVSTPLYQYKARSNTGPKTSILPSTGTVSGAHRYYAGSDYFNGTYYDITPTPPAAWGGWETSPTGPETILTTGQNNATQKLNGMAPLAAAVSPAWTMTATYLWGLDDATRKGPFYYRLKIADAPAVCIMPDDGSGGYTGAFIEATG